MMPAVNFSTLPCLVSFGVINVSLGGVNGALLLLSCGATSVETGGSVVAVGCD